MRQIVTKYDASHARFARAAFSHQKDLLLLDLFELGLGGGLVDARVGRRRQGRLCVRHCVRGLLGHSRSVLTFVRLNPRKQ